MKVSDHGNGRFLVLARTGDRVTCDRVNGLAHLDLLFWMGMLGWPAIHHLQEWTEGERIDCRVLLGPGGWSVLDVVYPRDAVEGRLDGRKMVFWRLYHWGHVVWILWFWWPFLPTVQVQLADPVLEG